MPTRYGRPEATIRTLPHEQPPVNRSMRVAFKIKRLATTALSLHYPNYGDSPLASLARQR